MSKSNFILRLLWVIGASVLTLIGLFGLVIGLFLAYRIVGLDFGGAGLDRRVPVVTEAPPGAAPPAAPELSLGAFGEIGATGVFWAPVGSPGERYGKFSSGTVSVTRNIVFYDLKTGVSRPLLPTNATLILGHRPLQTTSGRNGTRDQSKNDVPTALLFEIVEADSNGDKALDLADGITVALSRPDGGGLVRLEGRFDKLLDFFADSDRNEVVLIVETAKKVQALHVDLASFKIRSSEAIPLP